MLRKLLQRASLTIAMVSMGVGSSSAQTRGSDTSKFPDKPVHLIIPAASGSVPDALARLLGGQLSDIWRQPVIVENVVGAGGNIGHERGAKAPPDGLTLLMGLIGPMSVNSSFERKLPFDPVKDLAPITLLVSVPNILVVHPSVPVKNLQELIAYAKQYPDKLRYGHPGSGTGLHLAYEQVNLMAGTKIQGVPYKSSTQMTTDIVGGHIETIFHNASIMLPLIRSGALRAIAITSAQRIASAPDIPTMSESGLPGYQVSSWFGMYVPAATPKPLVTQLNADIVKALAAPPVKEWILKQAAVAGGGTPNDLAAFQAAETIKWKRLITSANIKAD